MHSFKPLLIFLFSPVILSAQSVFKNPIQPSAFEKRWQGFEKRKALEKNSLVKNIKFRSVGPSIMSGRVVDVDVNPADPAHFYVAYASGGLWVTHNNGQSFEPVFDNEAAMTLGDIAVDWKHGEIIWAGTGENNSSRSSYSGTGIYKSTDKGKTWEHKGLGESHHTGRIILHPENPQILWVAITGHLYSPNQERGIYKTTDGGKTWKHTLYIDDNTGAIDLVLNPLDPQILYAAAWHRQRRAWDLTESGIKSGIYKSADGGDSWKLISVKQSGFPQGDGVGRIGLCIYPKNPDILYAVLDNQFRREKKKEEKKEFVLTQDTLRKMTKEIFLLQSDSLIGNFLKENDFDEEYSVRRVKNMIRTDSIKPVTLVEYLEDANSQLFDTDVIGAEVYRSDDAGGSWKKTNSDFLDYVYNTYGYYFGQIAVSPIDSNKIFIAGVPVLKSDDGGKTFKSVDADNMHGDYHAFWINPAKDGHIIIGNDGGLNITYDDGKSYFKANTPAVGQFYSVQVDMDKPYNIYGGLQDNGVWTGPSTYKASTGWHESGKYPWKSLLWGDGMQVMVDMRDNNTVYTGFQFGWYYRVDKTTGETKLTRPKHKLGERPLRFNWQAPIWLSKHNQDILYMGSNKFHRSMKKGNDFVTLTGDMTKGGRKGDVAFGTITSIHESPLKFGLLYFGTDDGLMYVSHDAGYNWKKISDKLPQDYWVKRVIASAFDTATVYACLNGYHWDNFLSLLFVSKNYGQTWERTGQGLPDEPLNVVREDPVNRNILYAGSDNGCYVSIDRGKNFMLLNNNLPAVAVHDLVIHPRENELVVGTHGRSVYVAGVKELQQLTDSILQKEIYVFQPSPATWNKNWGRKNASWQEAREPEKEIAFYLKNSSFTFIRIKTDSGHVLHQTNDTSEAGLNYVNYDLSVDSSAVDSYNAYLKQASKEGVAGKKAEKAGNGKYYMLPGRYVIEIENAKGIKAKVEFVINEKGEMK